MSRKKRKRQPDGTNASNSGGGAPGQPGVNPSPQAAPTVNVDQAKAAPLAINGEVELSDSDIELVDAAMDLGPTRRRGDLSPPPKPSAFSDTELAMPAGGARRRRVAQVALPAPNPKAGSKRASDSDSGPPPVLRSPPPGESAFTGGFVGKFQRKKSASVSAIAVAAAIGAFIGTATTWVVTKDLRSTAQQPTVVQSANPAKKQLVEAAALGDKEALSRLEARAEEDRSVAEIVSLAEGQAAQATVRLREIQEEVTTDPEAASDPKVLSELAHLTYNKRTAFQALGVVASMPGEKSADLLYQFWVGTRARTPVTALAEQLVRTEEVRAKASKPLATALALREAKDSCEKVAELLPDIKEHGDARSAVVLARIKQKTKGCGPKGAEDCYTCLREGTALDEALEAAKGRAMPRI